jgi:hypothetical protein
MPQSLTELRQLLSRVKPWVAVTVVLAVALVGYYAIQGARYWRASQDTDSLNSKIRQLSRALRSGPAAGETVARQLETQQLRLAELRSSFNYPSTDELVAIVFDTARATSVELASMSVGDQQPRTLGETKFQVQPVALTVQGNMPDIYRFLAMLQERVPVVALSSINLASLDLEPSAQLQLLFYLLPEPSAS